METVPVKVSQDVNRQEKNNRNGGLTKKGNRRNDLRLLKNSPPAIKTCDSGGLS